MDLRVRFSPTFHSEQSIRRDSGSREHRSKHFIIIVEETTSFLTSQIRTGRGVPTGYFGSGTDGEDVTGEVEP